RVIMYNQPIMLYLVVYPSIQVSLESTHCARKVTCEALIPIQNGQRIIVLENGRAKELDVEIGTRTGNEVHVLTNLHPGDTVLTYGVMSLQDGSPVEVTLIGDEPLTQTQ